MTEYDHEYGRVVFQSVSLKWLLRFVGLTSHFYAPELQPYTQNIGHYKLSQYIKLNCELL